MSGEKRSEEHLTRSKRNKELGRGDNVHLLGWCPLLSVALVEEQEISRRVQVERFSQSFKRSPSGHMTSRLIDSWPVGPVCSVMKECWVIKALSVFLCSAVKNI